MAEDEWSGQNNHTSGNNWTTYDANSGWNATQPSYNNQPAASQKASTAPSKKSQRPHKQAPPQRNVEPEPPAKDGFSMFVTETAFPTWDD